MSLTSPPPAPHPARLHPARTSLRTLLAYLLTAALAATCLVLAAAPSSHAAAGHHTPITWNMQGGNAGKWTTVASMANGRGSNYLSHDVVALQEAGPLSSVPGTTIRRSTMTVPNGGGTFDYEIRQWHVGSSTRGRDVYITWVNTDPGGNRNNVAIVTHDYPVAAELVRSRNANGSWGARPAVGVVLADGSWFYSFHASSNGDNSSNDAQNMVSDIASARSAGSWAVLGDFNRRPALLNPPSGVGMYRSNQGTHQSGGELDYMLSNDTQNMAGWTGRRLGIGGSDHFAVEFSFRAAAEKQSIMSGLYQDECINRTWNDWVMADHCDGIGYEDWTYDVDKVNFFEINTPSVKCMDVQGQWTSNGTSIDTYECNGQPNQGWTVRSDGTITSWASGKCLNLNTGSGHWLNIWDCNNDLSQQWIVLAMAPYVWTDLTQAWNGNDH